MARTPGHRDATATAQRRDNVPVDESATPSRSAPPEGPRLALNDVALVRDGTLVLDAIGWKVEAHQRWVVIGSNGAGKTSLLRIAALTLHPTRGSVSVVGETLGHCDVREVRSRIGFAGATVAASLEPRMTALEVVMTGIHAALAPWWHTFTSLDRSHSLELLDRFESAHLADHGFSTLSSGERQRVLLARTLIRDPEIVFLDEPTAGLDVGGREQLVSDLAKLASDQAAPPVVLVTHHLEEIPPGFTHALALRRGRVSASGEIAAVLDDAVLSETFGLELRVERAGDRWAARLS